MKEKPFTAQYVWMQDDEFIESITIKIENEGAGPYMEISTSGFTIDRKDIDAFCERLKWCFDQVEE